MQGNTPIHLGDELVGRHLLGHTHNGGLLPWVGEDGEIAEHDDVGVGHVVAQDIDKAIGLRHVVAGDFERSPIMPTGVGIIRYQQDAPGAAHCDASSPSGQPRMWAIWPSLGVRWAMRPTDED